MKLRPKLLLFALVAIIAPITGIALYSGIFVYRSGTISELEKLEEVARGVRNDVLGIQDTYCESLRSLAVNEYLRSKLYVYSKYWGQIDSSTLEVDIIPLKDEIEKKALAMQIESVAVYRRGYDKYNQVAIVGNSKNIPDAIYFESIKNPYNQSYFYLYSDGIYLNAVAPVYASNNEVGLVLLQRSFNSSYFTLLSLQHGVHFALYSKGRFVYSSLPGIQSFHSKSFGAGDELKHESYRHEDKEYNLVLYNFDLGNGVTGTLFVGSPKSSFFQNRQLTVYLAFITLFCIFIPVLTFYLWGNNLIHGIRQLVTATKAVAQGNYDHRISDKRGDELGSLSSAFNAMTITLEENTKHLRKSYRDLSLLNSYIDAVFHSLLLTTLVIDRSYNIVLANQSAQSSLNLPEQTKEISVFSIPFFSEHRNEIVERLESVLQSGLPAHITRLEAIGKSYSFDFFPVADGEQGISTIVLVIIDITEHLSMERAMVRYEKLAEVGKLAAGIAHEIGNPMGVILNHVQLIATGELSEEEEREFIKRIESEVRRINALVEKLLHISRDESGEMRPVGLAGLVEEVLELFSPKLKQRRINAQICGDGEAACIVGNPDSLKQVFFNIFNNAIQSIEHDRGLIKISIDSSQDRVRVSVQDNGKGIEKAVLERLFDPFVTDKNSTGLGLYMSSRIVKRHGATISVDSLQSEGTAVMLDFPKGGGDRF